MFQRLDELREQSGSKEYNKEGRREFLGDRQAFWQDFATQKAFLDLGDSFALGVL